MTNKEAASIVERIRYYMEGGECWTDAEFIAMDMAIEALGSCDECKLENDMYIAIASPDNWDEKPKFYPEDWREIL